MSPPPALLIFDIMSLILQYVGDNKGTMLALGLTCHKLLEPMLDEIWRHLDKAPALLSLADLQWPLSTPKTTLSKFCVCCIFCTLFSIDLIIAILSGFEAQNK